MTESVDANSSLAEWIRNNKREAARRSILGAIVISILLYAVGEAVAYEWAVQAGIWLFLLALVAAVLYKWLSFLIFPGDFDL